jgi:hypothetical protein
MICIIVAGSREWQDHEALSGLLSVESDDDIERAAIQAEAAV